MTRVASFGIFVLWVGIIGSCNTAGSEKQKIKEYYNLDSLISKQIMRLAENNALLYKKAIVNGDTEEKQMQFDSAGWARELTLFREADLNKPAFSNAYSVKKGEKDIHSNLFMDIFTPVNDEALRIKFIRIYYLNEINSIKKIEIVKEEENKLFYSSLHIILYFDNFKKEVALQSYLIEGKQKLRLKDTIYYTVEGRITYP